MGYYINISSRDWLFVLIFGIVFGGFLGAFISLISGLTDSISNGFILGVIFGGSIFIYSFLLINGSNKYLLKHFQHKFWTPISLFVSFIAGSLGSITAYTVILKSKLIQNSLPVKIVLSGSVLIGFLTAVIGYLLYTIVSFRKKEMDLEKSVIESRLKALEYQINPHYLFNSLNVIAELIHIDPAKAEEAIIKLSRFLRDVIDESSLIPIKKELEIVKNFLFIQTVRFPNINIYYSIDETVLDYKIPKLTIQILVENAIKHGVRSKGNIWVEIYRQDDYIIIRSIDDGKMFKEIKEGVGLRNLRTRLYMLTGADLTWNRTADKTVFTVRIPVDEKSADNTGNKPV